MGPRGGDEQRKPHKSLPKTCCRATGGDKPLRGIWRVRLAPLTFCCWNVVTGAQVQAVDSWPLPGLGLCGRPVEGRAQLSQKLRPARSGASRRCRETMPVWAGLASSPSSQLNCWSEGRAPEAAAGTLPVLRSGQESPGGVLSVELPRLSPGVGVGVSPVSPAPSAQESCEPSAFSHPSSGPVVPAAAGGWIQQPPHYPKPATAAPTPGGVHVGGLCS